MVTLWYGPTACRSCLSRQPYAHPHVANHEEQSAGRQVAGFGCPTARPGARDSLICEPFQAGHLRRRDALFRVSQANNIDHGIRMRADLTACKG